MVFLNEAKPPLESLVHYGVKGMHWGIRRDRESGYSGPQLSKEARTLEKGSEFQTVTAGGKANLDRRVFTAHNTKDKLAYRSTYAKSLKAITNNKDTYTNTLVATKDLKVASEKDAFDTFKKLYESDKNGMTNAIAESYESLTRMMLGLGDTKDQKLVDQQFKTYSKKGEKWIDKQGYDLFLTGAGTARTTHSVFDSYYTNLAKQGFDAVVDEVDKKAGLSDDPIILLKPKSTAKLKDTVPLSEQDIKLASQLYKQERKRLKAEAKAAKT